MITKTSKIYDLEERTLNFAKATIAFSKNLNVNLVNSPLISQLIRSAGSVGANYREANEALSKKDFIHRLKISRKECKESTFWLELIKEANPGVNYKVDALITESKELRNILTAIIGKAE